MLDRIQTDQRGMVLVTVLWLMVFLGLLGATLVSSIRVEIKARAYAIAGLKAQVVADGLMHHVARQSRSLPLFKAASQNGGATVECRFSGYNVTVAVTDLAGLIDLNMASRSTLAFLFQSAGEVPHKASRLADAVLDYRDRDNTKRGEGAELAAYKAAGLPFGPKNAPFQTVNELDQVVGISPDLVEKLSPWLTVHAPTPGLAAKAIPVGLAKRLRALQSTKSQVVAIQLLAGSGRTVGQKFQVSVDVKAKNASGATRHAIVVGVRIGSERKTYLSWSSVRFLSSRYEQKSEKPLPKCLEIFAIKTP